MMSSQGSQVPMVSMFVVKSPVNFVYKAYKVYAPDYVV